MSELKILMSNIGYARGLSGTLAHHVIYAHRHFYCSPKVQKKVMSELKTIITRTKPDICCLLEIDRGADSAGTFSQLHAMLDEQYCYFDIANKYKVGGRLERMAMTSGKCNAFFANREVEFERLYFSVGHKRLVHQLSPAPGLTLFFSHFSLKRTVRQQQFAEICRMVKETPGERIVMGDFNILAGIGELHALLEGSGLILMNDPLKSTFRFHRQRKLLDICLCSPGLKDKAALDVIDQEFSDHDALLLTLSG